MPAADRQQMACRQISALGIVDGDIGVDVFLYFVLEQNERKPDRAQNFDFVFRKIPGGNETVVIMQGLSAVPQRDHNILFSGNGNDADRERLFPSGGDHAVQQFREPGVVIKFIFLCVQNQADTEIV